jgi:hypothetical protein
MPLEVLLILVVGGIAGIALLLQLLGYSRAEPFTEDTARAAWVRAEPDVPAHAVHLSDDRMAALVETGRGPAIVWHMGTDTTAHWLKGARTSRSNTGLRILLNDFAAPSVRVKLSPGATSRWLALIEGGQATPPEEPHAA